MGEGSVQMMDDPGTLSTLTVLGAALVILFFVLVIISVRAAYKSGIRDGYQNSWLIHVKKQVREENLEHGDEVDK